MKKLLSTVLFSAVALSAVALSKPGHVNAATKDTDTTVSAPASDKTEADVTYNGGATTVWTSPTVGQQVKRYVATGEHLKFINSKKVYAEIWYETSDHGWVPERYLSINTLQQLSSLTKKADATAVPTQTTSTAEQVARHPQIIIRLHPMLLLKVLQLLMRLPQAPLHQALQLPALRHPTLLLPARLRLRLNSRRNNKLSNRLRLNNRHNSKPLLSNKHSSRQLHLRLPFNNSKHQQPRRPKHQLIRALLKLVSMTRLF